MDMIDNNYNQITECRISNSKNLTKVLDLGLHPLANSLKKQQFENETKYPLTLSFCKESSLLQLNETIKKEILFDSYVWVTSTSSTAKNYSETFFADIKQNINLDKEKDLIIEIASNDGTFLNPLLMNGFRNVPSFDAISIIKSFSLSNLIVLFTLEKKISEYFFAVDDVDVTHK